MNKPALDFLSLLNDLARSIRTEADKRARLMGMTRAQWIILKRLRRFPGSSQRELAEILEVEPITVGRLVDRLEARKLVERRPDPEDRRIWRLHLCEGSDAVLDELDLQLDTIVQVVTAGIEAEELRQISALLEHMKVNIAACRRPAVNSAEKESA